MSPMSLSYLHVFTGMSLHMHVYDVELYLKKISGTCVKLQVSHDKFIDCRKLSLSSCQMSYFEMNGDRQLRWKWVKKILNKISLNILPHVIGIPNDCVLL